MSWADRTLVCGDCGRTTYRAPGGAQTCKPGDFPAAWSCEGTLRAETPEEGSGRRQKAVEENPR